MGTRSHPTTDVENDKYIDDLCSVVDKERVIKAMLTENTGKNLLDSGSAYGRHWEKNQQTPPWEKPRIHVESDYIVKNVYHHLHDTLQRDDECALLERQLYDFCASDEYKRESWLTCMEEFADRYGDELTTFNTYNSEFGSLTQCIQVVGFNMGGGSFVAVQVHGGCDIRGGYTKPRVFNGRWAEVMTREFEFNCGECGWRDHESTIGYETIEEISHPHENECECPECGHRPITIHG